MIWTRAELERLWSRAEAGDLDPTARRRLNAILADERALDAVLDQLEVDALLRWHHGGVSWERRPGRLRARRTGLAAAAALLACAFLGIAFLGHGHAPPRLDLPDWDVRVARRTAFLTLAPQRLRLSRGELRVRSRVDAARTLIIETPHGVATAAGTTFTISTDEPLLEDGAMTSGWTRILVLSGVVTMANAHGVARAQQDELIEARDGEAPRVLVVRASDAFGYDLLRRLSREWPEESLFFSPYSIASVLTMAAEGARGETARELARVLRWPIELAGIGEDDRELPRLLARIQSGHRAMAERFDRRERDPEQGRLQELVERLDAEMAQLASEARALRERRDWQRFRELQARVNRMLDEREVAAAKLETHRLEVVNGLWAERTKPFDPAYLATLREVYARARFETADFAGDPERERRAINAWIAECTAGRIPELLAPGQVGTDTRLVLLNAIHLRAQWLEPFDVARTQPAPFTRRDGTTTDVPLMHGPRREDVRYGAFHGDGTPFATPRTIPADPLETRPALYPDADGFQVLTIPYRGRALEMVVLLPMHHGGLARLVERAGEEDVARWLAALEARDTTVWLPRFEGRSRFDLRAALAALGASRAFDLERADFSGMVQADDGEPGLFLSALVHEAFVRVDEEGTEAAAATAGVLAPGSAVAPRQMPFVPTFRADRPFLYLIRDRETGVCLFLGTWLGP